jgi:hypothetical protein
MAAWGWGRVVRNILLRREQAKTGPVGDSEQTSEHESPDASFVLRTHSHDDEHQMPGLTSWQGAEKIKTSMRVFSTRCATRDIGLRVPLAAGVNQADVQHQQHRHDGSARNFNVKNKRNPSFSSTETTGRLELSYCSASIKMAEWGKIFSVYVF